VLAKDHRARATTCACAVTDRDRAARRCSTSTSSPRSGTSRVFPIPFAVASISSRAVSFSSSPGARRPGIAWPNRARASAPCGRRRHRTTPRSSRAPQWRVRAVGLDAKGLPFSYGADEDTSAASARSRRGGERSEPPLNA
jgi:hypothetical protein